MRESNFSFPAQNRACVTISSQLYDRRALDTNSPLPLFNSLTHLVYLTSTSPRIREILTMDGGLERLVRMLRDFAHAPPPPDSPTLFYGLMPEGASVTQIMAKHSSGGFDVHAAYRFSLAFQCVVNIGVRGSEAIRSRVVQAGTLDVVGCILETWLRSKGYVTYPCASASGLSRERESKEQRQARRELRLLHQQQQLMASRQQAYIPPQPHSDTDMNDGDPDNDNDLDEPDSNESSLIIHNPYRHSPAHPTHASRTSRSATITQGSRPNLTINPPPRERRSRDTERGDAGPSNASHGGRSRAPEPPHSANASASASDASPSRTPSPAPTARHQIELDVVPPIQMQLPNIGIVDTDPNSPTTLPMNLNIPLEMNLMDPGILAGLGGFDGLGGGGLGGNMMNDDLAMGAPPGAPGATVDIAAPGLLSETSEGEGEGEGDENDMDLDDGGPGRGRRTDGGATPRTSVGEATPRPPLPSLPATGGATAPPFVPNFTYAPPIRRPPNPGPDSQPGVARMTGRHTFTVTVPPGIASASVRPPSSTYHPLGGSSKEEVVPYKEDDVLLSLQLLAYLSKYPHVRQAFYKPRRILGEGDGVKTVGTVSSQSNTKEAEKEKETGGAGSAFLKVFGVAKRDKDKDKEPDTPTADSIGNGSSTHSHAPNVFALVERFTFRPHMSERELPNGGPPALPPEITYWAGVIMRNACRKDDLRGGIRQCASMVCGKWEKQAREFAKCRRCRKARYCGKECQSRAWAEGHRFWCSARENPVGHTGDEWSGMMDLSNAVAAVPFRRAAGGGAPQQPNRAQQIPTALPPPGPIHLQRLDNFVAIPNGVPTPVLTAAELRATMRGEPIPRLHTPHRLGAATVGRRPPSPLGTRDPLPDRILVGTPAYESDEDGLVGSPTRARFPDIFSRQANRLIIPGAGPASPTRRRRGAESTGQPSPTGTTTTQQPQGQLPMTQEPQITAQIHPVIMGAVNPTTTRGTGFLVGHHNRPPSPAPTEPDVDVDMGSMEL